MIPGEFRPYKCISLDATGLNIAEGSREERQIGATLREGVLMPEAVGVGDRRKYKREREREGQKSRTYSEREESVGVSRTNSLTSEQGGPLFPFRREAAPTRVQSAPGSQADVALKEKPNKHARCARRTS